MTVFVVHPIKDKAIDLSSAAVYGDVSYVNKKYVFADELDEGNLPENVVNGILRAVDRFEAEADYLLIAGDHLQLVAMSAYLNERWGEFRVLRYDREAQGYIVANIRAGEDSYHA